VGLFRWKRKDAPGRSPERPDISVSILRKRWRKFRTIRRGYYSFILLCAAYLLSFFLPLFINSRALAVRYEGKTCFPVLHGFYEASTFGQERLGEANYRALKNELRAQDRGNWVLLPFYPYSPVEDVTTEGNRAFVAPSWRRWLGTDDRGRDVFARMAYGFNISISFALILTFLSYVIGCSVGACMGYFGGRFDLYFQRVIEILMTMPFLFTVIIVASIIQPTFWILLFLVAVFTWFGMTFYLRAEFYREKAKDYVAAAIAMGQSHPKIMFKHIFPNSLTPVITFFPFSMVGGIGALVSLDFLGFGLPPPTPSWGEMVHVGLTNIEKWWLVLVPLSALFVTLLVIVFIGEALREAFDPKVYSRLR
jgi:microcin C transport system permease protein